MANIYDLELQDFNSEVSDFTPVDEITPYLDKQQKLNIAAEEKRRNLDKKTPDTNQGASMGFGTSEIEGNTLNNRNKIYNSDNALAKQEMTSDFASTGYYWEPKDKSYRDIRSGNKLSGKIGGVYHGNLNEGDEKVGYYTVDTDSGLSPEEQLNMNYDKYRQSNTFGDLTGGYEPARDGVNSILLGNIDKSKGLEAYLHGNTENLRGRKYGFRDDQHMDDIAGRSYTEIVKDGSVFGDSRGLDSNREMSTTDLGDIANANDTFKSGQTEGFFGSLARAPKALLAGGAKSVYDFADTSVELVGDVVGRGVGLYDEELGKKIDKNVDIATGDEKTAQINSAIGYDDSFNRSVMEKSGDQLEAALKDSELLKPSTWGNTDVGLLKDSFLTAFSSPEAAAYSLGYIAPALAGAAEKAVVKLFGGAIKSHADDVAKVIGSNLTSAAKKQEIRALESAMSAKDKVKLFVAKNADAGLYGATMNNDQMDEWIEANGGEEPSILRMGLGTALNAAGMKLDMGSAKFALNDSKDFVEPLVDAFKDMGKGKASKAMAKAAEYTARMASSGMTELPQEFMQSFIEAFNTVYGTDDRSMLEVAGSEEVRMDAAKAAVMGAAGGAHMSLGSQVTSDAGKIMLGGEGEANLADKIKNIREEQKTETKKEQEEYDESTTPKPVDVTEMKDSALGQEVEDSKQKFEMSEGKDNIDQFMDSQSYYKSINEQSKRLSGKEKNDFIAEANKNIPKITKRQAELTDDIIDDVIAAQKQSKAGDDTALNAISEKIALLPASVQQDILQNAFAEEVREQPQGIDLEGEIEEDSTAQTETQQEADTDAERVVDEEVTKKKSAHMGKKAKKGKAKSAFTDTDLDAEQVQTDEHVVGVSARTINKLAEKFGIKNVDLQKTLKGALGVLQIRKMKEVGKKAGEFQQDIYHGEDGFITKFAEYRGALANNDKEAAVKAINSIQRKGYTQDRRLNRYVTKYDEIQKNINEAVAEAKATAEITGETEAEVIANSIKVLDKADYTPSYSTTGIKAKDIAKDMDLPPEVFKALNVSPEGKSNTLQTMLAMKESILDIDKVLASSGHTRQKSTGTIVSGNDKVTQYENTINTLKTKIDKLEAIEKPNLSIRTNLAKAKESLANNEAGIARIQGKQDSFGSSTAWVENDTTADVAALKTELKDLKKVKEPTAEDTARISEIESTLSDYSDDARTAAQVKANLSKPVGEQSEGSSTPKPSTDTGTRASIDEEVKTSKNNDVDDSTVEDETINEDFKAGFDKDDLKNVIKELEKRRAQKKKVQNAFTGALDRLEAKNEDVFNEVSELMGKDSAKIVINADKAVESSLAAIEAAKVKIKKLKSKITDKNLLATLDKKAKELATADRGIDETRQDIISELEKVESHLEKEGVTDTSTKGISKLVNSLKKQFKNLGEILKGTRGLISRFLSRSQDASIAADIARLEKSILKNEGKVVDNTVKKEQEISITKTNRFHANLLLNKLSKLRKQRDKYKGSKSTALRNIDKRIAEILGRLKNNSLTDKWLVNNSAGRGMGTMQSRLTDENGNEKSEEMQELDLNNSIDTGPSILGALTPAEFAMLLDDKTGKAFLKEFDKAKEVLGKTLYYQEDKRKDKKEDNPNSKMYPNQLMDSPMSALMFDNKDMTKLNDQFVMAITLAGMDWAGTDAASNLFNSSEDIARMLGYVSEAQVTGEERTLLQKKGSYRKVIVHSLGEEIFRSLNLNPKPDTTREMYDKMVSDAGLMTMAYLEGSDLIKDTDSDASKITSAQWNKVMDQKLGADDVINMIVSDKKKVATYKKLGDLSSDIKKQTDIAGINKSYMLTRPPKNKDYNKVKGSIWNAPQENQDTLKVLEDEEYGMVEGIDSAFEEVYGKFDQGGKENYMEANGWMDLVRMKLGSVKKGGYGKVFTQDAIDAQEGKNRDIERSVEQFQGLTSDLNDGMQNNFFFRWFLSKNGRFMLDSAGINPQTDKLLHRWAVLPKAAQNMEWDLNNKEDHTYFIQGLVQGFGGDIDKLSTKEIKRIGKTILGKSNEELVTALNTGELTIGKKTKLEPEHPGHALQAIVAMKAYRAVNTGVPKKFTPFKATMTSEYDSVTSGFINKLLQTPILAPLIKAPDGSSYSNPDAAPDDRLVETMKWLNKGGIFDDKTDLVGKGMNDVIASAMTTDVYRTLVEEVSGKDSEGKENQDILDELGKPKFVNKEGVLEEHNADVMASMTEEWQPADANDSKDKAVQKMIVDGTVTPWARNMFKYPFMIFNYGASIARIRKNLANDLADNVVEGILNSKYSLKEGKGKTFLNHLGIKTEKDLKELQDKLVSAEVDTIWVGKKPFKATISKLFNETYGRRVEEVMSATFKPLVDVNKAMMDGTKLMFQVFITEYDRRVEKFTEDNKRSMTPTEDEALVKDLVLLFPLIKAPNSASRDEGAAIVDEGMRDSKDLSLEKVVTKFKSDDKKGYVGKSVQAMIKEFKEAHAAGAVLPIHWIDGTIIGKELIKGGKLGVHDAIVIGKDFVESIKGMNKATYDTGVSYNLLGEVLTSVLDTIEELETNDELDINMLGGIEIGFEGDTVTPSEVLRNLTIQAELVQESRDQLYGTDGSNPLMVMNFADTAGTGYLSNKGGVEVSAEMYEKVLNKRLRNTDGIDSETFTKIINEAIAKGC